jgi:hypothetical protein
VWFVLTLLSAASRSFALAQSPDSFIIDHRYSNTDAQSLIGLPMGSHKTVVERDGSLKWSQWSLKRKPLDTPIGFSSQMDGALAIQPYLDLATTQITFTKPAQALYKGRYPFIVSDSKAGNVRLEELAFSVDPEQNLAEMPTAASGTHGLDLVRLTFTNDASNESDIVVKLSGRERNLPGHVDGLALISRTGEDVAMVEASHGYTANAEDDGLTLALKMSLAPRESRTLWIRLPYEWPSRRNGEVSKLSGENLLQKAVAQWDAIWARGARVHYAQQELNDFFDSSIAYVLILTEFDAQGDLWAMDGPAVYRQFWGRGEYFQARAMEVAGQMLAAKKSVDHTFHIQIDDGEWDGPPTSGYPAWDNTGGNAAAVWDYYLYSRDKDWLAHAYPYLLKSSEWVKAHREETTIEDVPTTPEGARPVKRLLASKCRVEINPPLAPGEKTYWYGLLPYSYGDSGLPEGHSYSHNFLADYGVEVSAAAARELGKIVDAAWMDKEYADFTSAIRTSVARSVGLETITPAYLPAQPTRPEAAYSQTFLAVWPTRIYKADDPLVTGLLDRMEKEEVQGEPTNVAWAGPAGIWPGESMNMSETYLLRGDVRNNADMLLAALNHSYTTKVWKEEILTDVTKERACDTPHSKRENMQGTGDQPEAWGNANLVDLLRDMLVQERGGPAANTLSLHLLAGLPADWLVVGKPVALERTPTTLGTTVSVKAEALSATKLRISFSPGTRTIATLVFHLPLAVGVKVHSVLVNGKKEQEALQSDGTVVLHDVSQAVTVEMESAL